MVAFFRLSCYCALPLACLGSPWTVCLHCRFPWSAGNQASVRLFLLSVSYWLIFPELRMSHPACPRLSRGYEASLRSFRM